MNGGPPPQPPGPRAAHVAGDARRLRGGAAAAQPDLARRGRGAGRRPAGPAHPGLHGRRRHAGDDGPLAARERLLDAAGGHPRECRLLSGRVRADRGAARGTRRPHRREGRDHRPEPRRRAGPRGRRAPARPRLGHRHARRPHGGDAASAPAGAAAGRARRRARNRPGAGPVQHELPARRLLRAVPIRAPPALPARRALRLGVLAQRRDRRLARLPRRRGRRAGRDPRLALRDGGQPRRLRAGRPRAGGVRRADRSRGVRGCRTGHCGPVGGALGQSRSRRATDSMCGVCGNMSTGRTRTSR